MLASTITAYSLAYYNTLTANTKITMSPLNFLSDPSNRSALTASPPPIFLGYHSIHTNSSLLLLHVCSPSFEPTIFDMALQAMTHSSSTCSRRNRTCRRHLHQGRHLQIINGSRRHVFEQKNQLACIRTEVRLLVGDKEKTPRGKGRIPRAINNLALSEWKGQDHRSFSLCFFVVSLIGSC